MKVNKHIVKMSKTDWERIGREAGWMKKNANFEEMYNQQENARKSLMNNLTTVNAIISNNFGRENKDQVSFEQNGKILPHRALYSLKEPLKNIINTENLLFNKNDGVEFRNINSPWFKRLLDCIEQNDFENLPSALRNVGRDTFECLNSFRSNSELNHYPSHNPHLRMEQERNKK